MLLQLLRVFKLFTASVAGESSGQPWHLVNRTTTGTGGGGTIMRHLYTAHHHRVWYFYTDINMRGLRNFDPRFAWATHAGIP